MFSSVLAAVAWIAHFSLMTSVYGHDGLSSRGAAPSPISVPPTQSFDGNDGPWSSFFIAVGSPAQTLRVFISTAVSATWVIISKGCPASVTTCPSLRGGIYDSNTSTTWQNQGDYELYVEGNLGIVGAGIFGNDSIGIGSDGGPVLQNQIIGGIAAEQFWLGMLGVNPKPTNFTTFESSQASFMDTLKEQDLIPSVSFGYTAGNQYRLKTVLGSLTLGGYDSARFEPNDLSFDFAPDDSRDLVVGIQGISYTDETQNTHDLLNSSPGILAYVDSTIAEIWLPASACAAFEDAFGLVYDPVNKLYPVNSTWHAHMQILNPNVTFTLGNTVSGGPTIDIILPYAAFDLQASWPKYPSSTLYFPLQPAANETQYTLGRTFLQEAYLIVDWERGNFSVSQCIWPPMLGSNLVPITSPDNSQNGTSHASQPGPLTSPSSSTNSNNTIGVAVGVAVGILCLVTAVAAVLVFRRRKARHIARYPPPTELADRKSYNFAKLDPDSESQHALVEAPGSLPLKEESESTQLLTPPPPSHDKDIHPAFRPSPPFATVTVSELKGEGKLSPSRTANPVQEMYGSPFVPFELPAGDQPPLRMPQELVGSNPTPNLISLPSATHSSLSSSPLMDSIDDALSSLNSSVRPTPPTRMASLRGVFNRPAMHRRQETDESIPSLPSRGSPDARDMGHGEYFTPVSPVLGNPKDFIGRSERNRR